MKKLTRSILLVAALASGSTIAFAQNINGPTQIITVATTIPPRLLSFQKEEMIDGINADLPHNGFEGDTGVIGKITFTLDKPYDLDQSYLWNDINVVAEGVKTYKFNFYDAGNILVGTTGIFSVNIGQIAAHIESLSVANVKKVEMEVLTLQTSYNRVEIREVAFNGTPTLPTVDVTGEHYQCYRVTQGKSLAPTKLKVADQFGRTEIVLGMPVMLCNPSAKFHNGKMYEPINPQLHQVCYQITNRPRPQRSHKVKVSNQFATRELTVLPREMFCVPSTKNLLNEKEYNLSDFIENP